MYVIPILLFNAWTSTLTWLFYYSVTRLLPDNRIVFVKGQNYKEHLVIGKMWLKPLDEYYVYLDTVALLHLKQYLCKTNVKYLVVCRKKTNLVIFATNIIL